MAKAKISEKDYYVLQGLKDQHKKLREKLDTIEEIAVDLVGEEEEYGHIDDFLWDDRIDLETALDRLGIKVYKLTSDDIDEASIHFIDTDNSNIDRLEDEQN